MKGRQEGDEEGDDFYLDLIGYFIKLLCRIFSLVHGRRESRCGDKNISIEEMMKNIFQFSVIPTVSYPRNQEIINN